MPAQGAAGESTTVIDVIPMIKAPSAWPTWLVGAVAMLLLAALKGARISTHGSLGLVVKSLRSPKPPACR